MGSGSSVGTVNVRQSVTEGLGLATSAHERFTRKVLLSPADASLDFLELARLQTLHRLLRELQLLHLRLLFH